MARAGYFTVPAEMLSEAPYTADWTGASAASDSSSPDEGSGALEHRRSWAPRDAAPRTGRASARLGWARSAVLLALPALLLLLAIAGRPRRPGSHWLWSEPGAEVALLGASEAEPGLSDCGPDVLNVDFWTGVPLYEVQHVSSAADCRSKCKGESKCGAWTWGSDRHVQFLTDVCFLKAPPQPGHPMQRHPKNGVVSGLPCRQGAAPTKSPRPPAAGQSEPFDCDVDDANWQAGWSGAMKRWCCDNKNIGCDSVQPKPASARTQSATEAQLPTDCHAVVDSVDFWTGTPLYEVDQIGQARDCRAKCDADPKCGAWTWGKKPGISGLEGVCFLKGMPKGQQIRQDPKKGVESGVPCRTSAKAAAPATVAATPPQTKGAGNCGEIEEDADYRTSAALSEVRNVATAEICLLKCEGDPKCGAWSWGKARDSYGLTDVCFLKGLRAGETAEKHPKRGVVSGLPCHTSSWLAAASAPGSARLQHYQSKTLFCFALMLPHSYEQELLAMQNNEGASLFGCDRHAVYSNMTIMVAPGVMTHVVDSDLKCSFGGEFGTALNTPIFMAVWRKVVSDGIFQSCDWTAKVDPDAVFLPARLRGALEAHAEAPEGVYINNCWRGMHGPLELFSRNAVKAWSKGMDRCTKHFNKLCNGPCLWGEDMFVDQCLWHVLGVRRDNDYATLTEDHCDPPPDWRSCKVKGIVAFHPFKKPDEYQECLLNADPLMRQTTTTSALLLPTATVTVATTPLVFTTTQPAAGLSMTFDSRQDSFEPDAAAAGLDTSSDSASGELATEGSSFDPDSDSPAPQPSRTALVEPAVPPPAAPAAAPAPLLPSQPAPTPAASPSAQSAYMPASSPGSARVASRGGPAR